MTLGTSGLRQRRERMTGMSNLGLYQLMTTIAKKIGGPIPLLAGVAALGWGAGRLGEAGGKMIHRKLKERGAPWVKKDVVFKVTTDGEDGDLQLHAGDEFRVLECDGDAILIEVLGDDDNPYFVSAEFLATISGFPQRQNPTDGEPSSS